MKKKILVLLVVVMFFAFIGDVKAYKVFNGFKEGDKISVYLNKSDVGEFTVVEDSSSDEPFVLAIYNTYYGSEEYGYNDAKKLLDEIENNWANVDVSFVDAEQIVSNFNDADVDFTTPSWAITNFNYWTANTSYYVENQVGHSAIKKDVSNSKKAYVRPVIRVSIQCVKEGINRPASWNQFVEYLTDVLDKDGVKEGDNYTYGNDFINIKLDESNYANFSFDGSVLKLVEGQGAAADIMLEYVSYILPFDELLKIEESNGNVIKTDNFTLVFNEEYDVSEFAVNLDYYFGFNKNTASSVDNEVIDDVQNPKTGDINIVIIGVVTLITLTVVIVGVKRLKKLSK